MRDIQIDMANFRAAGVDDRHLLGGLEEIERLDKRVDYEAWNSGRIASFTRPKRHFAGKDLVVGLLHLLFGPRLQNGIVQIRYAVGGLDSGSSRRAVVNIRITGIIGDRTGSFGRSTQLIADFHPAS